MQWIALGGIVLEVVLTAIAFGRPAEGQAASREVATQVDKVFAEWNRSDGPGCAVAAIQDGNIVFKRGYGMANLEYSIPITTKSVFDAASVTQPAQPASRKKQSSQAGGCPRIDEDAEPS